MSTVRSRLVQRYWKIAVRLAPLAAIALVLSAGIRWGL